MTVALQLAEEALEREEAEAQQALEDAKREEVEAKVAADKARKEMREAEAAAVRSAFDRADVNGSGNIDEHELFLAESRGCGRRVRLCELSSLTC